MPSTENNLNNHQILDVHHKIGNLTRQLHDALTQLGHTEKLKASVGEIPDVKSRLSYIAKVTGNAAEKVLNLVDDCKISNSVMLAMAQSLGQSHKNDGATILHDYQATHDKLDEHLTDIMMAQDFHDLTGQVIARIIDITTVLEKELVELLIQTSPGSPKVEFVAPIVPADVLIGPAIDSDTNPDVMSNQSQVDDLLASFGF